MQAQESPKTGLGQQPTRTLSAYMNRQSPIVAVAIFTLTAAFPALSQHPFRNSLDAATDEEIPLGIEVTGNRTADILHLEVRVDIPPGSYVISALSPIDFKGKFQINWSDSTVAPASQLTESPFSVQFPEPFSGKQTPVLREPTTIRQAWKIPADADTLQGKVLMVLEPQCVLYALDFWVSSPPVEITNGWVHPENPD